MQDVTVRKEISNIDFNAASDHFNHAKVSQARCVEGKGSDKSYSTSFRSSFYLSFIDFCCVFFVIIATLCVRLRIALTLRRYMQYVRSKFP